MIAYIGGTALLAVLVWLALELRRLRVVVETASAELYDMVERDLGELKNVETPPVQVKVVMPSDVEVLKQDATRVRIEHRQPDGSWHPVGETDAANKARIALELATPGRRIIGPDGIIQEGIQ